MSESNLYRNAEWVERSKIRPIAEEMAIDLQKKYGYMDSRVDWVELNPCGLIDITMTFIDEDKEKKFKTKLKWDWDSGVISMPAQRDSFDDEMFGGLDWDV